MAELSVAISVDASRVRLLLDGLSDRVKNLEQGLLQAVDAVVMPALSDESTSVWNVRTGNYSSSWYSQIAAPNTVMVGNDARNPRDGYPYNASLEWGWLNVESPGVLYPTVYSNLELLVSELVEWIQSQTAV